MTRWVSVMRVRREDKGQCGGNNAVTLPNRPIWNQGSTISYLLLLKRLKSGQFFSATIDFVLPPILLRSPHLWCLRPSLAKKEGTNQWIVTKEGANLACNPADPHSSLPRRHAASHCAGAACDRPKPETSIVAARLHRWLPPAQAWCLGGWEAMTMRRRTRALCTLALAPALLCVAAHFQGASCRSGRGGARGGGGASFGRKSGRGGGGGSGGRRGGAGGGSARTAAASGPSNINGRRSAAAAGVSGGHGGAWKVAGVDVSQC